MTLSVVLITHNEEVNIARTLESVAALVRAKNGEIIVVDSGSTDRTVEIATARGARVFVEEWKGYAAQKNSAIAKASGDWILSLDADEELDVELQKALGETMDSLQLLTNLQRQAGAGSEIINDARAEVERHLGMKLDGDFAGLSIPRKNEFLGQWMKHGGYWPDRKLRFFRRGTGTFEDRLVHESLRVKGKTGKVRRGALRHHCYPTVSDYIAHMNRYSLLGAEMAVAQGRRGSVIDIAVRPVFTFFYNYFARLGFLDGRKGLLLHINHAIYISWKYAKVWELSHKTSSSS